MENEQTNLHPNPLSKPNGLTTEGLARIIAVIETDIKWIKKEFEKRNGQIDELEREIKTISKLLSEFSVQRKSMADDIEEIKEALKDHENRIRAVERHDWIEVGIASAIGSLIGGGIVALLIRALLKAGVIFP